MATYTITAGASAATIKSTIEGASGTDVVEFEAGTYTLTATSGTTINGCVGASATSRVLIRPQSGAAVTLNCSLPDGATFAPQESSAFASRALHFQNCKYITVQGKNGTGQLTIDGGVSLKGTGDWPVKQPNFVGIKTFDPTGFRAATLEMQTSFNEFIRFQNVILTGRGFFFDTPYDCDIWDCIMRDLDDNAGGGVVTQRGYKTRVHRCTIGPLLVTGSNQVHKHFAYEGTRFSNTSCYNEVLNTTVSEFPGLGRGLTQDGLSSWNVWRSNTVNSCTIGLSEQAGSWHNLWENNTVLNCSTGFQLSQDGWQNGESLDRLVNNCTVRCNDMRSSNVTGGTNTVGFKFRWIRNCTFSTNRATKTDFLSGGSNTLFNQYGNKWDGAGSVPSDAFLAANLPAPCGTPNTRPTCLIDTPAGNVVLEQGNNVNYTGTATDADGTIVAHSWTFEGGSPATSTSADPGNVLYSTPGTYTTTYTVLDDDGEAPVTPAVRTITVTAAAPPANTKPTTTIDTPVGNQNIEEGTTLNYTGTASDSDGTVTAYLWTFEGGTPGSSTEQSPGVVLYDTPGTYTTTFTCTDNSGDSPTTPDTITVTVTAKSQQALPVEIDLETGDLSSFSATTGSPAVSVDVVYRGVYSCKLPRGANQANVVKKTGLAHSNQYTARCRFYAPALTLPSADYTIIEFFTNATALARVKFTTSGFVSLSLLTDAGTTTTDTDDTIDLANLSGWQFLVTEYQRAMTATSSDGAARVHLFDPIAGAPQVTLCEITGLDNFDRWTTNSDKAFWFSNWS